MLRLFVLLLLLANGTYFAWSQGYLASMGLAPAQQTEPQRLQNQIQPDAIRLLNATEAKRVEALASAPLKSSECLQSALLSDTQTAAVRSILDNLPTSAWRFEATQESARWIVYMGKYSGSDALAKKKTELRELGLPFEALKNPTLEPGLSLGVYASQAQANESMNNLAKRGVRTAKVVQELPERQGQLLKLPDMDDTVHTRLESIKAAVGSSGLTVCK